MVLMVQSAFVEKQILNVRQHAKNFMALHAQMLQTLSQNKIKLTSKEVFLTLLIFSSILLLVYVVFMGV